MLSDALNTLQYSAIYSQQDIRCLSKLCHELSNGDPHGSIAQQAVGDLPVSCEM